MTIKTTGTGDDLRVLANAGEDEIQRVSCSCCDACASVPDEITIVFSGLTGCPASPAYPAPLVSATLTRENPNESHGYQDALHNLTAGCVTAKQVYEAAALGFDLTAYLPEGIAPDDTSTPLFIIQMSGESGDVTFLNAFIGYLAIKDTPVTNIIDLADCGIFNDDLYWTYGGTATISW